jgi:hypothetical protein
VVSAVAARGVVAQHLGIWSFIITPLCDGKDSQSVSARRTESYRLRANISYFGSHTAGPASRNCLYPGHLSSNASSV